MEKYSRNRQIIDSEIDDSQVMMNLEKGKYFGLNPVGKRIWELIVEPKSSREIIEQLLLEFDVTEDQCSREVEDFLNKAAACDIVMKHGPGL